MRKLERTENREGTTGGNSNVMNTVTSPKGEATAKQERIWRDFYEKHWTGDCEANDKIYCWVLQIKNWTL
jgi:hypothetical protein